MRKILIVSITIMAGFNLLGQSIFHIPSLVERQADTKSELYINYHPTFIWDDEELKMSADKKANGKAFFCVYKSDGVAPNASLTDSKKEISFDETYLSNNGVDVEQEYSEAKFLSFNKAKSTKLKTQESYLIGPIKNGSRNEEVQVSEYLFFSKYLSKNEVEIVESYLSMKYGISLPEKRDYYNGKGNKIMKYSYLNNYKYRASFIGRDDESGLYQKQSTNSSDTYKLGLAIANFAVANSDNASEIKDNTYMVWSDNGEAYEFELGDEKVCKRQWLLQKRNELELKNKLNIRIGKTIFNGFSKSMQLYLLIDESGARTLEEEHAKKIEMKENGEYMECEIDAKFINENERILFTFKVKEKEEERSLEELVIIYPNPIIANQDFKISYKGEEEVSVEISDVKGVMVYSSKLKEELTTRLSMAGAYTVKIKSKNTEATKKLIVQ